MSPEDKTDRSVMTEGFIELSDRDVLLDDPDRIEEYRSVARAEGFQRNGGRRDSRLAMA